MATPAGKAGKSRPWTERSEGSGSAPPAESVHPERKYTVLINYFYFKRKKTVDKLKFLSLSTV